jgi:phage terminase large subunit-like protein
VSLLPPNLPLDRRETITWWAELLGAAAERGGEHEREVRRWLCRNDLFFLLVMACGRKDINRDWLFERCREVQAEPNGCLDLWAREHYKSTIVNFGLCLQDILASHGEDPEARYGGREVTIGIFSHTRPIAKAFLVQLKRELEANETLKALFPDVLWSQPGEAPKWSEDGGLIVRRRSNPKEATVEAWGLVDGQPTSKHFLLRVYDDVVTRESVYTPEQIKKTTEAWELSDNLGSEGGWVRYIGTRYHHFDTYHTMMERGVAKVRQHPCTADGSEDFSRAVLMAPETLAEKRRVQGPYTFGAQMLLNPTADSVMGFQEDWLRFWPAQRGANLNVAIVVDPASKKKKTSDYTTMWVVGIGGDGNWYILDGVRDRLNLTERTDTLFALHRRWSPKRVGYEEYGLQADIEHIEYVQAQENYRFPIVRLGGGLAKEDRIKRLVPRFERGGIYLPEALVRMNYEKHAVDLVQVFKREEYLAFPVCAHDDMLDCLARMEDEEMHLPLPTPKKPESDGRRRLADVGSAWSA